ncbi:glycoside hydrolase family 97 N-terminal domain-containing protein, partial [Hoylesella loescheii]
MRKIFFLMFLFLISTVYSATATEVTSPNGTVKVTFNVNNTVPTYTVTFRGKPVIKPSRLGFALVKGGDLL